MDIIKILDELGKLTIKDKDIISKVEERKTNHRNEINGISEMIANLKKEASKRDVIILQKTQTLDGLSQETSRMESLLKEQSNTYELKIKELREREQEIVLQEKSLLSERQMIISKNNELEQEKARLQIELERLPKLEEDLNKRISETSKHQQINEEVASQLKQKEAQLHVSLLEVEDTKTKYESTARAIELEKDKLQLEREKIERTKTELSKSEQLCQDRENGCVAREEAINSKEANIANRENKLAEREKEVVERLAWLDVQTNQIGGERFELRKGLAMLQEEKQKFIIMLKEKNISKEDLDNYFK